MAAYQRQMDEVFESWNYLLYEKLDAADHIATRIYQDMGLAGVPVALRSEYIAQKLKDMIEQIADRREPNPVRRAR